ncbi:MAG: cyclic nucleotide-binding domain-containing protein [Candidatus Hatepunaea meridiana]|nr:cyclic nucleotide-binding domain-containing protein [Candidatus Hatepunaea meridiana]
MTEKHDDSIKNSTITEVEWVPVSLTKDKRDSDMRRTLSSLPLFENISTRDWRELASLFHKRTFSDEEIIFRYGTPGLGMYIVIDGNVVIYSKEKTNDVEIARLGPGSFFGEMSLIDEIDRSATAVSSGNSNLIGIFRPQLKDLMYHRPRLGLILMERLACIVVSRLREADKRLMEYRKKLNSEN